MWYYLAVLFNIIILPLLFKALKALGIMAVSYVGINLVLDQAASYIQSQMGQTTLLMQQMLGVAKVDIAINIYLSAITTRAVLAGMNKLSGRKKDFILKA
ncbi:DUF2523 domain-containing protein [Halopseudomonas sp.]|uniref:DUF2523 domain-containing protein n=1 Tax=Halopseudomonas sp. TaxID=2901191 RepID=UPI0030013EA9